MRSSNITINNNQYALAYKDFNKSDAKGRLVEQAICVWSESQNVIAPNAVKGNMQFHPSEDTIEYNLIRMLSKDSITSDVRVIIMWLYYQNVIKQFKPEVTMALVNYFDVSDIIKDESDIDNVLKQHVAYGVSNTLYEQCKQGTIDFSKSVAPEPEPSTPIVEEPAGEVNKVKLINMAKDKLKLLINDANTTLAKIYGSFDNQVMEWKPSLRDLPTLLQLSEKKLEYSFEFRGAKSNVYSPSIIEHICCQYHLRPDAKDTSIDDLMKMYTSSPEMDMFVEKLNSINRYYKALGIEPMKVNSRLIIYVGPPGTGKSVAANHYPNVSLVLSMSDTTTMDDFVKMFDFVDGKPSYQETSFIKALRNGDVVQIEELQKAPPSVVGSLQTIFDGTSEVEINGVKVKIHPNFKCIVTMNDTDLGSRTVLPEAFLNRAEQIKYFNSNLNVAGELMTAGLSIDDDIDIENIIKVFSINRKDVM